MPRVACVMMQRDEDDLLEPWLAYHGNLFGHENLLVIDHGSVSPKVAKILARYEQRGVQVDRSCTDPLDYSRKVMGARLQTLDRLARYDFLFPLDCDEFVATRTETGFTCDKAAIHAALEPLRGEARTLKIAFQFANIPERPDFYYYFAFQKTFFAADTFGWTDQGHHFEGSWKAPGFRETDITHIHFHNKPHELLLAHARRKLQVHVDPGDVEALRTHKGRSVHLIPYLTMSRAEYHARFDEQVQFCIPEFLALLNALKAPIRFAEDSGSPRKRAAGKSSPEQSSAQAEGGLMMLPYRFDPAKYIAANPDVARAGVDPLVHFCKFGFKEGRRVRPRVK